MISSELSPIGIWKAGGQLPAFAPEAINEALHRIREPIHIVRDGPHGRLGVAFSGQLIDEGMRNGVPTFPLHATLPALYPEWLGDRSFLEVHGVRFPYVTGAMANGIATADIVIEMGKAGMLGFFGAAGLSPGRIEENLIRIEAELNQGQPWGSNLIHSPNEPKLEEAVVDLYLKRKVRRVSASAYMALTPAVVRYAYKGVHKDENGQVVRPNFVFAKISRPETARRFMSPAPLEMLKLLLSRGELTKEEVMIAARLPVAEDIIVEADSGGHTDNQTLTALFPTIVSLRDELVAQFNYTRPVRVGAAGGLGTPSAIAAAFALGAAFALTGSVNQGAVESGLSETGRKLLATAGLADVMMAPAADMFELGVKVQVLKRGTMFAVRAHKLYDVYVNHDGLHTIEGAERKMLESQVFKMTLDEVWGLTESFWKTRDPQEVDKAAADPKHKMALAFRWYLGLSSRWAIAGTEDRAMDYQIWCGPAMGAFNAWAKGSFLEVPENRTVVQIAKNLLEGAAVVTRAQQLRSYGVPVPQSAFHYPPRTLA